MLKKIDFYIIRTFLGPFFFIFTVLFFIFIAQFAYAEIDKFTGKGLGFWDIAKMLYYYGTIVIQLVLPLTILLASIMTFGSFGENYELAALKSAGVPLFRVMVPLFLLVGVFALGLFYFSNNILPQNQKKARQLIINIANTRPAFNFVEGRFISTLDEFTLKVSKKYGKNDEFFDNIIMHRNATSYQDQRTILAKKGILTSTQDNRFLKFTLFDGIIHETKIQGLDQNARERQPYQEIKFDTLIKYIDVSSLVNKKLDQEVGGDFYKSYNYLQLNKKIDSIKHRNDSMILQFAKEMIRQITKVEENEILSKYDSSQVYYPPYEPSEQDSATLRNIKDRALASLDQVINQHKNNYDPTVKFLKKEHARMVIYQQRIFSYSILCFVFFMIGSALGSIIRKGGVGMPVVIAVVIFVIWFIIFASTENMAKDGTLNAYWAAWIPTLIFIPFGAYLTKKAMDDSDLFDIEKYQKLFQKIQWKRKKNIEHQRYQ